MPNSRRLWRFPNKIEAEKIEEKIEMFGVSLSDMLKEKELLIFEMGRKEVMLVQKRQVDLIIKLKPYTAGISFGEFKGGAFFLSLAGGAEISKYAKRGRVFLDSDGSLEFIYGRGVEGSYISSWDRGISSGDLVLVLEESGGYLGIGRAEVSNFRIIKVKNVIDIGWYLRSEIDEDKAV